ncbi:hypothetical protein [Brassicibacter mesophilus]|uniref:hypothetical protein n=1 Tax=Brassicibacter mesophilus TaxID=745119 RepID=UPI003D23C34C
MTRIDKNIDLTSEGSKIYNMCSFNPQDCCDDFLQEHIAVAYEENLDYYAELASDNVFTKFEELAREAESDVETMDWF